MYIFGVLDKRRTPIFLECGPPVDRAATNTYGTAHALPRDLDCTVEQLLHHPSPSLDPVLLIERPEELRRLDNCKPAIALQIGKQFIKQITTRGKVGVQYEDVLPG